MAESRLWGGIVDKLFPEWTAAGRRERAASLTGMDRALRLRIALTDAESAEAAKVFGPREATPAQLAERAARSAVVKEGERRQEANDEFRKALKGPATDATFQNRGDAGRAKKIFGE